MIVEDSILFASEENLKPPAPRVYQDIIARANVNLNGNDPWDIQVLDSRAYDFVLNRGTLGFGEAYVEGFWECQDLTELMSRFVTANLCNGLSWRAALSLTARALASRIINLQSIQRSTLVGEKHYDIGMDVYSAMLDKQLCYSCGYWEHAQDLDDAQTAKLELICQKLKLEPGMTVLDVGCGWGSLSAYMAKHYKVKVTGITISNEQAKFAKEYCKNLPVDIQVIDYRKIRGQFDRIVSVGMFEHVGNKNYASFFQTMNNLIDPNGLFLLHTIGTGKKDTSMDPWIEKYIFPNGELPSLPHVSNALTPTFRVEDLHNFGGDYETTLIAWWENFLKAWPELSERYDERFLRTWRYYLLSCAGFFRSGKGQLWQFVLKPSSSREIYRSVRS